MKKRTKLKFYDVILYLVIFVFIGASIGGLAYLGKLMFSGYTDFSVSYDGLEYKASSEDLTLPFEKDITFEIGYSYEKLAIDKDYSYSVNIVPVGDFTFTVDGVPYLYSDVKIDNAFNLKIQANSFTLKIPGSLKDVLSLIYKNSVIVLPELDADLDYYKIVVSSHDSFSVVSFSFKKHSAVRSIVLSNYKLWVDDNGFFILTENKEHADVNNPGDDTGYVPDEDTGYVPGESGGGFDGGGGGAR